MTRYIQIDYTKGENYNHGNDKLEIIVTITNERVSIDQVNAMVNTIQDVILK